MYERLIQWIQKHLPEGSFIRNVVTLMSGTTFGQVLMILAAPVLTRLYSPENLGVYGLYNSILAILAIAACWRYELAIVIPEKDEDAAGLLVLSILICFFMTIFTVIIVALNRITLAELLKAPELAIWLSFLPLSLIVAGLFQSFNYWSIRRRQFKLLAIRQITQSSVTVASQLIAGKSFYAGPWGLISGSILGQVVATIRLAWVTWNNDHKYIISSFKISKLKNMAVEYKRFPLFMNLAGLMNILSREIPIILLGYYFEPIIVGYFVLGRRVVDIPLSVVQGAYSQVFFPSASDAFRNGNLSEVVFKAFSDLFAFILVPIVLLIIAGPDLISVVFGDEWRLAGLFLVWMAPRILAQFISSPLSSVFVVLQRQDLNLIIDSLLFVSNIGLIVTGGLLNNYLLAIQLFGIGTFVCYIIACLLICRVSGISIIQISKKVVFTLVQAVPYVIFPLIALLLVKQVKLTVGISVLCGCLFLIFNARKFSKIEFKKVD